MLSFSLRDIKLITEFKPYNEIQLISLEMDDRMAYYLSKLGFDLDYPVSYLASNHRDLQNKVGVGFRVVGDIQINREFLTSDVCDVYTRIAATSYQDRSLTRELCQLQNSSLNYSSFNEVDEEGDISHVDIAAYIDLEEEQRIGIMIKQLEDVRDAIRGSMYNEAGAVKTFAEYKKGNV